jgi:hypothetical protein
MSAPAPNAITAYDATPGAGEESHCRSDEERACSDKPPEGRLEHAGILRSVERELAVRGEPRYADAYEAKRARPVA